MAFIGLPWPKKTAGILLALASGWSVLPGACSMWGSTPFRRGGLEMVGRLVRAQPSAIHGGEGLPPGDDLVQRVGAGAGERQRNRASHQGQHQLDAVRGE